VRIKEMFSGLVKTFSGPILLNWISSGIIILKPGLMGRLGTRLI
jgi:hypothetical protein